MSMSARYFKVEDLWEVRDGDRWWTVHLPVYKGPAHICNEQLVVIKSDGALGKRILRAVAVAQGALRDVFEGRVMGEEWERDVYADTALKHPARVG